MGKIITGSGLTQQSGTTLSHAGPVQVTTTSGGLSIPSLTATDRDSLVSPSSGLLIFNTTKRDMQIYRNGGWQNMGTPAGTLISFGGSVYPDGWLLCDGSAVSRTTYADLFKELVTNPGFTAQTFTVTVASPAVFTKSSHGFLGGERVRLSTTGALPTGLNTTTDYYVLYVNNSTFQVSLTPGGTAVNTSGTQSGTHSYLRSLYGLGDGSTTFNLPDFRGRASVGAGTYADPVSSSVTRNLGGYIGAEAHQITIAQMPSHSHGGTTGNDSPDHSHNLIMSDCFLSGSGGKVPQYPQVGTNQATGGASVRHSHSITSEGGGSSHNNMQPSVVINYLIKY